MPNLAGTQQTHVHPLRRANTIIIMSLLLIFFAILQLSLAAPSTYTLTFTDITPNPKPGAPFSFNTNSDGPDASFYTIDVSLNCGSDVPQTWSNVPVLQQYNTTLSESIASGTACYLYAPSNSYFDTAQSSTFVVETGTITITSPTTGSQSAAGTALSVSWTTSDSSTGNTFNATLDCPGFPTITSSTTSFSTSINVPATYYGSSCTTTVSAAGYDSAQVTVIVTQQLSFSGPTSGAVVPLTTSSFPVKLVTSGGNVYDTIDTSFECSSSPGTVISSSIPANTNSSISVSSDQIGSCTLTITSAPTYLVLPSPSSITFTLKYTLSFTTVPSTVYRGQNFTIEIDTMSPASDPPSVTLNLICLTNVTSATWSNVLINQPNNLTMPVVVFLETCFFRVNSDTTYTQAVSSSVQVSKVPVNIDLPGNLVQYPIPDDVPLLVSTTVSPVSGTVHLRLNCTTMTTPSLISIPINTLGSFSYPSDVYGACRISLALNDPIFG